MSNTSMIPDNQMTGPPGGFMAGGANLQEIFFIQSIFMNFILPICLICAFFGSIVNIIVFVNLGLADSMVVSFLALSSSDLAYIVTSVLSLTINSIGLARIPWPFPVQTFFLAGIVAWYKYLSYDVSLYMTTYIAVARCCCVLMPLKFKNVFTVKVTVVVFAVIVGVNTSMRAPLLASTGLHFKPNATRLTVWYGEHWESSQAVHDILNQTFLTNACLILVVFSMVMLIYKLAEASRARRAMVGGGNRWKSEASNEGKNDGGDGKIQGSKSKKAEGDEKDPDSTGTESKTKEGTNSAVLSGRELQVVQAVVLVAGLFMVAVLFSSAQAVARRIEPRFDNAGEFRHLFTIFNLTGYALTFTHSGLNPFIYFRYNSKYRRVIYGWFSCFKLK